MFHICDWEGHERHNNEDACFYTPLAAYVTDRNRLVSRYTLRVDVTFVCIENIVYD